MESARICLARRDLRKRFFRVEPGTSHMGRQGRMVPSKAVRERRLPCRAYLEDAFLRGHFLYGIGGIVFSTFKSVLDIIAIGTGLKYKLLFHRARPLPDELRLEWLNVWELTLAATTNHGN